MLTSLVKTLMYRILLFLSLFILFIPFAATADTAGACDKKVTIATTHVPPLVEVKGEYISGRALVQLQTKLDGNLAYEVKSFPWARALFNTQAGDVDGLFPVLKSKLRMKDMLFVEPALGLISVSLFKKDGVKARTISDGATIATLRSFEYDKRMLPGAVFTEVTSFEQAVEMLKIGRVDYILGVKEIIESYINDNGVEEVTVFQDMGQRPIYLTLSKRSSRYNAIKQCLNIEEAI